MVGQGKGVGMAFLVFDYDVQNIEITRGYILVLLCSE